MTVVHLVRHGEVANPQRVLYGRLPGFHLSTNGHAMAGRAAAALADRPVVAVWSSPLERALESSEPIAKLHGLEVTQDDGLVEAWSRFEGTQISMENVIRRPRAWPALRNPLRPSWGEPYSQVAHRMSFTVRRARDTYPGGEVVLVSHQLPIWMARRAAEGRGLVHNPRSRECALSSVTSLEFTDDRLVSVAYLETIASG